MSARATAVVLLAAGAGTRMRSALPKTLHPIAGRPMIGHVLAAARALDPERLVAVVGADGDAVAAAVAPVPAAVQTPALGTAHAVRAARRHLDGFDGRVLIVYGDTPLITAGTMRALAAALDAPDPPAVAVLGFRPDDPEGYGRLVLGPGGALEAIVEEREARAAEREIRLCNAGLMAVDSRHLMRLAGAVGRDNAKGEHYLTDIVALARTRGLGCAVCETADDAEVMGVNDRADLARAEAAMQRRLRGRALAGGATLIDPASVHLSFDTALGEDVTIGPQVVFGPGVRVGDRAEIRAFSHIEGAEIGAGAVVGPFARLRPGARIGARVRIGNFVEIKAAVVEEGARVGHLSYVGDARVGRAANIGAGTITCNYDGAVKSRTEIGADAFVGSNSALVAPVRIGDRALVGAGSVITRDVPDGALALARGRQTVKPGRAAEKRRPPGDGEG